MKEKKVCVIFLSSSSAVWDRIKLLLRIRISKRPSTFLRMCQWLLLTVVCTCAVGTIWIMVSPRSHPAFIVVATVASSLSSPFLLLVFFSVCFLQSSSLVLRASLSHATPFEHQRVGEETQRTCLCVCVCVFSPCFVFFRHLFLLHQRCRCVLSSRPWLLGFVCTRLFIPHHLSPPVPNPARSLPSFWGPYTWF